jgi:2-hydroxy-4-carboxymuconate semialdehyde hemiacetal dehydrogenase
MTFPLLGLCVVGAGAIAAQHMKAFERIGGIRPQWVVSRTLEQSRRFAADWKFERASNVLDVALEDTSVQVVLVASPNALHADQACRSLDANKDVIVEIPIAMSLQDVERVRNRAAAAHRRVWVCHTMRSFEGIGEVRRRVQAGSLSLTHIVGFFGIPRRRNQGLMNQRSWTDTLLWHHACHQIDAALWVLGTSKAQSVRAILGPRHPEFGMAMDVSVQLCTARRQLVTQALTYNTEKLDWWLRFVGNEDVLTFCNGRLLDEHESQIGPASDPLDLTAQNRAILTSLNAKEPSDFDLDSMLPAMEVLHRAQQSAEEVST